MLRARKFGIQKGIGEQVFVGTISKCGTFFIDKEDVTQEFIRAAVSMWGGTTTQITNKETGVVYHITITETPNVR